MILEKEVYDELGQKKLVKNPVYTRSSVKQYVRSYQVNRDGVELLYSCTHGVCNGRGWYEIEKPNGLRQVETCVCVERTMNRLGVK